MLTTIGTISLGFVSNLLSRLVEDQVIRIDELNKVQEIRTKIGDFNRKFDNTILDSNAFQKYLDSSDAYDQIYRRIIRAFEENHSSIKEFSRQLSENAISYMNSIYIEIGWREVNDNSIFVQYFDELIAELIEIRNNVLNLSESIKLSIISDIVEQHNMRQRDDLIRYLEEQKEDNFFAEKKISDIEKLVDLYKFPEAQKEIQICLGEQNSLSISQREFINFQEARVLINTRMFEELKESINRISRINKHSKYLDEIEFYLACNYRDTNRLKNVIQKFISRRYSDEVILIRKAHFDLVNEDYDNVELKICPDLKIDQKLIGNKDAHYLFGVILSLKTKYIEANEQFLLAFQIRQNIIYKYNALVMQYIVHVLSKRNFMRINRSCYHDINLLLTEFQNVEYLTNSFADEETIKYWSFTIDLTIFVDRKKALSIVEKINQRLFENKRIMGLIANIYIANEMYAEAQKILSKIYMEAPFDMVNLFITYAVDQNWSEIIRIYEETNDINFMEDPSLLSFYLKSKSIIFGYDSIRDQIVNRIRQYYDFVGLVKDSISLTLENKDEDSFEIIFTLINANRLNYSAGELIHLCEPLEKYDRKKEIRSLIEDRIEIDEPLMIKYFITYEGTSDDLLDDKELYGKIKVIHAHGCNLKSFLTFKAKIEIAQKLYKKALKTLEQIEITYGMDQNYAYMYIYASIHLKKFTNLDSQVSILLKSTEQNILEIVAILYSYQSKWMEAERISLKALFLSPEHPSKEFLTNFNMMNLRNARNLSGAKILEKIELDTVVTLQVENDLRRIAIHHDNYIFNNDGFSALGCENYGPNDKKSILLLLSNGLNDKVTLDGVIYEIVNIEEIYAYFTKICFSKLFSDYPDQEFLKPISAINPEEAMEKIKEELVKYAQGRERLLDFYNFGVETSIPLSLFASQSTDLYADTIISILNLEKQYIYAGEVNIVEDKTFVLTLSSIIVLATFNILDKLEDFKNRIVITDDVFQSIINGAKETAEFTDAKYGYLTLTDKKNVNAYEYSKEDKRNKKEFWSRILQTLINLNLRIGKVDEINNVFYEEYPEMWHQDDLSCIEYCFNSNNVLVSDDLFIRKVHLSLSPKSQNTNSAGMMLSSATFTIEEEIDFIHILIRHKYLYPLNSVILCNLVERIVAVEDEDIKRNLVSKMKEIFNYMFDEDSNKYYQSILSDFMRLVDEKRLNRFTIFEIMSDAFKIKP